MKNDAMSVKLKGKKKVTQQCMGWDKHDLSLCHTPSTTIMALGPDSFDKRLLLRVETNLILPQRRQN